MTTFIESLRQSDVGKEAAKASGRSEEFLDEIEAITASYLQGRDIGQVRTTIGIVLMLCEVISRVPHDQRLAALTETKNCLKDSMNILTSSLIADALDQLRKE